MQIEESHNSKEEEEDQEEENNNEYSLASQQDSEEGENEFGIDNPNREQQATQLKEKKMKQEGINNEDNEKSIDNMFE